MDGLAALLAARGHTVLRFSRSSEEIPGKRFGALQAFFAGIYNPFARRAFGRFLDAHCPEVVHVHNLFPFLSPAILPECARRRVPVVMTLHNYRLLCPNALLLREGQPCHECVGGREWRCVRHNCERSLPKSLGYALRTAFARRSGLVLRHVDHFICLTEFQRAIHVRAGFPAERMTVIPNPAPQVSQPSTLNPQPDYVGYVGRVSPEKDVPTLMEAARLLPDIPFKVAGSYWRMQELVRRAPSNMEFLDHLEKEQLSGFFRGMRMLAFATRCYENFPTVLLEAMALGIPIVCARIGGLPEIVEDGATGLLYNAQDPADLAARIRQLWDNPALARQLGEAGRAKAAREYHPDVVYEKLQTVYRRVLGP